MHAFELLITCLCVAKELKLKKSVRTIEKIIKLINFLEYDFQF